MSLAGLACDKFQTQAKGTQAPVGLDNCPLPVQAAGLSRDLGRDPALSERALSLLAEDLPVGRTVGVYCLLTHLSSSAGSVPQRLGSPPLVPQVRGPGRRVDEEGSGQRLNGAQMTSAESGPRHLSAR